MIPCYEIAPEALSRKAKDGSSQRWWRGKEERRKQDLPEGPEASPITSVHMMTQSHERRLNSHGQPCAQIKMLSPKPEIMTETKRITPRNLT